MKHLEVLIYVRCGEESFGKTGEMGSEGPEKGKIKWINSCLS